MQQHRKVYKEGTETTVLYNRVVPKEVKEKITKTIDRIVKPYLKKQK